MGTYDSNKTQITKKSEFLALEHIYKYKTKKYMITFFTLVWLTGIVVLLTIGIFKFRKFKAYVKFSYFGFGFEGEK